MISLVCWLGVFFVCLFNSDNTDFITSMTKKKSPTIGMAQLYIWRKMIFPETSQQITLSFTEGEAKSFLEGAYSLRMLKWMSHKSSFLKISTPPEEEPDLMTHHSLSPPTQQSSPVPPLPSLIQPSVPALLPPLLIPPQQIPIQDTSLPVPVNRGRGRPRKWSSNAARVAAYKKSKIKQLHRGRPSKKRKRGDGDSINDVVLSAKRLRTTGDLVLLSIQEQETAATTVAITTAEHTAEEEPTATLSTTTTVSIMSNEQTEEPEPHDAFNMVYDTDSVHVRMTPDMGLGVFATKVIPNNTVITKYEGSVLELTYEEAGYVDDKYKTHWVSLSRHFEILAGHNRPIPCLGVGSLINSSIENNVKFVNNDGNYIKIVSCKDIQKGDQLFAMYKLRD